MHTLVDPPVTPYSDIAALRAWVDTCAQRVREHSEDEGWSRALEEARAWLAQAEAKDSAG